MTLDYMFWGFLAGFVLIALYLIRLGVRLAGLERRIRDL
jgi:CcmD family protein